MIYVATFPDRKRVKIGFTKDPRERLNTFRRTISAKVRFMALADGTLSAEHRLHDALLEHRLEAEWYLPSVPAVGRVIADLVARTPAGALAEVRQKQRVHGAAVHG